MTPFFEEFWLKDFWGSNNSYTRAKYHNRSLFLTPLTKCKPLIFRGSNEMLIFKVQFAVKKCSLVFILEVLFYKFLYFLNFSSFLKFFVHFYKLVGKIQQKSSRNAFYLKPSVRCSLNFSETLIFFSWSSNNQ